ncbi:hemolysin [Roseibium aquae]|uniref:Hemolysin n=1 Tax=Roseibium aquae TaxID=1323746 RepID=A0A916TK61_9HYPH|nr:TlyA family RNA methyltransferase [Roseibium aquae]GGB51543.1 hemolysin [Roseibium aquae]
MSTERLDQLLVARGIFPTRARARDAILRGTVQVDGAVCIKPARKTPVNAVLAADDPAAAYVSRAALKLVAGLETFGIDPSGRTCLDIGSSTGGFTQVLLERGAARVHAIDVGTDQFHPRLRGHPRVNLREGLNARDLRPSDLDGESPDLIVSDVSFISLKLALPPALDLARPGAQAVLLVKPQFEAGRERVGKGGLVDPAIAEAVSAELRDWLDTAADWTAGDLFPSPIAGGDGNREWLLHGTKHP